MLKGGAMRLLIVNNDKPSAEYTAQQLRGIDQPSRCIETITLADDLKTAIRLLPRHDIILCDGRLPSSKGSGRIVKDWEVVRREASREGIHFILYSACRNSLDDARAKEVPAIAKPAAIEEIYDVVVQCCLERWLAAISAKQ